MNSMIKTIYAEKKIEDEEIYEKPANT